MLAMLRILEKHQKTTMKFGMVVELRVVNIEKITW
jgi:hypothetical protein